MSYLISGVGKYLGLEGSIRQVHPTRGEDMPGSVLAHAVVT